MVNLKDTFWDINANGSTGTLTIFSVDAQGVFGGFVSFDDIQGRTDRIDGFWNEAAGQITFTRKLFSNTNPDTTLFQTYTGFLGSNHPENFTLAGFFTQSDIVANVPRINFGWFAQHSRPQNPTNN